MAHLLLCKELSLFAGPGKGRRYEQLHHEPRQTNSKSIHKNNFSLGRPLRNSEIKTNSLDV